MQEQSLTKLSSRITKYGATLLFTVGVIALIAVNLIQLSPELNIQTLGPAAILILVINYLVWDSHYKSAYAQVMKNDFLLSDGKQNGYYAARKKWNYKDLQLQIKKFNDEYQEAWLQECESLLGRTRDEIIKDNYYYVDVNGKKVKYAHRVLIWRLKHKKYPKSGLTSARQMLSLLYGTRASSSKIDLKASEKFYRVQQIKKIVSSLLTATFVAAMAIMYKDDLIKSLIPIALNIVTMCSSLYAGLTLGNKGATAKLDSAEEATRLMIEWMPGGGEIPAKEIDFEEVKEVEEQKTQIRLL